MCILMENHVKMNKNLTLNKFKYLIKFHYFSKLLLSILALKSYRYFLAIYYHFFTNYVTLIVAINCLLSNSYMAFTAPSSVSYSAIAHPCTIIFTKFILLLIVQDHPKLSQTLLILLSVQRFPFLIKSTKSNS